VVFRMGRCCALVGRVLLVSHTHFLQSCGGTKCKGPGLVRAEFRFRQINDLGYAVASQPDAQVAGVSDLESFQRIVLSLS